MKRRYVIVVTSYVGHRTYGIGLVEYDGRTTVLSSSFPDLSRHAAPVRNLVHTCNRLSLDPEHLRDVVQDFLDAQ